MPKFRISVLRVLFALTFLFLSSNISGQIGKDGARVINAANTIVNDYTSLIADANAGAVNILVNSNAFNTNFATPLAAGDLIFIIQMQGAFMVSSDDSTYGSIINYLNAGNHEFAQVVSVSGANTIRVSCGLQNSYISSGKTQVIRVPRYSTLSLLANTSITCPTWNGASGGVVVLEVQGQTVFNTGSSIDVSGRGFRPGLLNENLSFYGVLNWRSPNADAGAEKGEGIGGSTADYDLLLGRYGKGAPANGGGGGNAHNAGGGGGANAGTIVSYTGSGVPDISNAAYIAAWNQETPPIGAATSSGGGKGGYTNSSFNMDATTTGPFNTSWGGDFRRDNGGRGGRPLDYTTGRIFMGGGGGAGDQNSSVGGMGGAGGGIVYIYSYDGISGTGSINANGANGANTVGLNGVDGAGGAGGAGTIIINSTAAVSGITLNANGGNGGNQTVSLFNNECEGPGGGGGGGYIGISNGTPVRNANGGNNGVTNSNAVTEFPPNGATRGGAGIANGQLNAFRIVTSPITVCAGTRATLSFTSTGTPPAGITYNWYNSATGGSLLGTGATFLTPVLNANVTYWVGSCPGHARFAVPVTVISVTASYTSTTVCAGNPTNFSATATTSSGVITGYTWDFGDGSGTGSGFQTSYTYPASGTYQAVLVVSNSFGCNDTVINNVTVSPGPAAAFTNTASGGCSGLTVGFTNTTAGATSFVWNFGDGSPTVTTVSPSHTYPAAGTYTVSLTASGAGCSSTVTQVVTVGPRPTASYSYSSTFCLNDSVRFTNISTSNGGTITSYQWNFGNGQTSTQTSPVYQYPAAGTYNVTLTALSGACTDDTTISITITPAPIANFSTANTAGCGPYTVTFTNSSTGTTSFSWAFGDGGTSTASNPTYTYNTSGTYSVTLIAANATCPDTLRRTGYITVVNRPRASFTSSSTFCANDPVAFLNSSVGNGTPISSYSWNFGNSQTSTQTNPVQTYTTPGTYNVTLTANNGTCTDDTVIAVTVAAAPVANFTTSNVSGCTPYSVTFTNSSSGTTSFSWDFGDGNTSTSANPTHTYTNPGTYTVRLIAVSPGCSDTLVRTNYIQVSNSPTAAFTVPSIVCFGSPAQFTNSSTGNGSPITSTIWAYGNGGTSSSSNPSYTYPAAGIYNVLLTVSSGACSDTATATVNVQPAPVAGFTGSPLSICRGSSVSFTNTTIGTANYSWSFGDGGTSTSTSPTYQYNSVGSFTVRLIATAGTCVDTFLQASYVNVLNGPTASFSTSTSICQGDSSIFVNNSNGNGTGITGYTWNFGNGNTSTQVNPRILYSTPGTYQVTLTASNGTCSDDSVRSITVAPSPVANFSTASTSGCSPYTVTFTNASTGTTTFSWDFGDGNTSASANPTHTYTASGTYTVRLIAVSAGCSDTLIRTNYIQVNNAPTAAFSVPNTVCLGSSVQFSNSSTGNGSSITSTSWTFGNGGTSTALNPSYTYPAAGTYNVLLTVSSGSCSDTATSTVSVQPAPVASFTGSPLSICRGSSVSFTNTTSGTATYNWNFGDGSTSTLANPVYQYNTAGTFTITLIASAGTCADTVIQTAYVNVLNGPTASFSTSPTVCLGDSSIFVNNSNGNGTGITGYTWNFGNGNTSSTTNPRILYSTPGIYQVTLTATNGTCSDDSVFSVNVNVSPVVSFSASSTFICGTDPITFTNTSTGTPAYTWNFGDGNTSTAVSPTHTYANPGTYTVTLIATQGSCGDTLVQPAYITTAAQPIASFSALSNVCLGESVSFTNSSVGNGSPVISYTWNFGDGNGSTAFAPTHTYNLPGVYTVTLTADNGQCSHDTMMVITVILSPIADFSAPTGVCLGNPVTFSNNSFAAVSYDWNFGDGNTSSSASPVHTYNSAGVFTVTLIARNNTCRDTLVRNAYINVSPRPTASFAAPSSTCQGSPVAFTNSSNGNGSAISGYSWNFGNGNTSTASNPSFTYTTSGTYAVTLTVTNGGCSDDTTISISINPSPVAAFTASLTNACAGTSIFFNNTTTGTTTFNWDFGDGNTSTAISPLYQYNNPGTYTVTLIAVSANCSDTLVRSSYINIFPEPTASFAVSNGCFGDTISFTNLSTGNGAPITIYQWTFGDGNNSSLQGPSHFYSAAGNYLVTLTSGNGQCTDDTTIVLSIAPRPTASFSTATTNVCANTPVTFSNTTSGTNTYNWIFGDGNTSTVVSPTHSYVSAGTYTVTLIAAQGSCADTLIRAAYIDVDPVPTANFTVTSGCLGDTTRFSNLSIGNGAPITTYNWNFGDGGTSSSPSPSHLYAGGGTYSVSLIAGNGICSHDTTITVIISAPPVVSYSASVTSGCDSLTVQFSNTTTGASSYFWNFGDGQTSTTATPTHTYTLPGVYSILLSATSGSGCSANRMQMNLIRVLATPVPSFTASSNAICQGECISFTNTSTGNPTSLTWTFGGANPSVSSLANPSNICYGRAGSYEVTLRAANGTCSASTTLPSFITVADCNTAPVANFIGSDTVLCSNDCISFSDLSSNATSWQWFFAGGTPATSNTQNPDNICYPTAGVYDVRLIVANPAGSDTLDMTAMVSVSASPALPVFTQSGDTLIAPLASSYQWYRNGIAISGATNQRHVARLSGNYSVMVFNAAGCSSISNSVYISLIGIDDLEQGNVSVYPNPATDHLNILLDKLNARYDLIIYNSIGQLVYTLSGQVENTIQIELDRSVFAPGTYILNVRTETKMYRIRFIVSD